MKIPPKLLWKCFFFFFTLKTLQEFASLFYTGSDAFIYYHTVLAFLPDTYYLYMIATTAIFIDLLCLAPFFGYAFDRPLKAERLWQILFFLRIAGELFGKRYDHLFLSSITSSNMTAGIIAISFFILFLAPSYIGHYLYAFRSPSNK